MYLNRHINIFTMFGSMSQTPEIDITEFSPTRSKSSIPDEEPSDAEDAFEFAALKIAELIPVEPQKPVAFDDLHACARGLDNCCMQL